MHTPHANEPRSLTPTRVFFDSQCPICKREVACYQKLDTAERLAWIDLRTQAALAAELGIEFDAAMTLLHVLDDQNQLHIGLAGHIVMWSQLPRFKYLAAILTRHPTLARYSAAFYQTFTRLRPGRFIKTTKGAHHE